MKKMFWVTTALGCVSVVAVVLAETVPQLLPYKDMVKNVVGGLDTLGLLGAYSAKVHAVMGVDQAPAAAPSTTAK